MKYLALLLLSISLGTSYSQIAFYKQFSNNGDDFGQGVIELPDSSYLITGSSSSFTGTQSQAFLLKLDSLGNYIWSNNYGGAESDWGRRVLYKENFGIFICGFTNSFGNGGFDFYLIKTDLNGNFEWERSYGSSGWDRVYDAKMTLDTGVIMVGETNLGGDNSSDMLIIRTNKIGDTLWTKTLGAEGLDIATGIEIYQDSLYIVAGNVFDSTSNSQKPFIVQLDDYGAIIWSDTLGTEGDYRINDIIIIDNILQGVGSFQHIDSITTARFSFSYDVTSNSQISQVQGYENGSFKSKIISYYGDSTKRYIGYEVEGNFTLSEEQDLHFGRFSNSFGWMGQVVQIFNEGVDSGEEMIPTSDGGAIAVGYTTSGGSGGGNVFVLKIGPNELYPNTSIGSSFDDLVKITKIFSTEIINIYPNPATTEIRIQTEISGNCIIQCTDTYGRQLLNREVKSNDVIDISEFDSGLYSISIYSNNRLIGVRKLVIL
ncbi:MAG: T9SS type A sorting domain-containing protein [Crocinitomicaceae bacterium]|nr:T9SS type A sorting domain-containing protein [Crocinitomicaceae bacterium]